MSAIEANWPALFVFIPAWFIGCVGAIYLSGNLPVRAAPKEVQAGFGPALVWLNVVVLIALVVAALAYAIAALAWTTIIVAGGFVFLFAPFVVQDLPDRLRDTRLGLTVLLCLGTAALVVVVANI